MFYFVPSWYGRQRQWYDNTPWWFRVNNRMTFDDSVNQVKMFLEAKEEIGVMILNYQPQLRYFLHNQGIFGTYYWSFFDDIQNITRFYTKMIHLKDLNWPKGSEFFYSPFAVIVRLKGKIYAVVNYAENGNIHSISFQKNEKITKDYIFDDRGFLSSILYYDIDEQALYQDYLNTNGVWQVREFLKKENDSSPLLMVNDFADKTFSKKYYNSWKELIEERLTVFRKNHIKNTDIFVVASHEQHNQLISTIFKDYRTIYSFFGNRFNLQDFKTNQLTINEASFVVADTERNERLLKELFEKLGLKSIPIMRLSPFDSRLRLGHSQTVKEQIIYFFIDNIERDELYSVITIILELMSLRKDTELRIVTFRQDMQLDLLKTWIIELIKTFHFEELFFKHVSEGENELEDEQEIELSRIVMECFTNENQIIECLDTARLVIDLGLEPDLYTQIASISAGIPQINRVSSDYVEHQKNGLVISEISDLSAAIDFYFDGLSNWNEALIYTVQKMSNYTSVKILEQWKQMLENRNR